MATIPKNVLVSLTTSLNNIVSSSQALDGMYQKELNTAYNILDSCYEIPKKLRSVIDFQVTSVSDILDSYFSLKKTIGFNKEIDDTENQVYNIFREFDRYKDIYSDISGTILEKLSSIEEIHELITNMKNIAREIKLFSINSVIVASQAGSDGIAFKSISRFIIELSDSIQKSASQLEVYRDKILTTHNKIEALFSTLIKTIYEKEAVELKQEVLKKIKATKSHFNFLSIIIDDIFKRIIGTIHEGYNLEKQYQPGVRRLNVLSYWSNALAALSSIPEKDVEDDSSEDILTTLGYSYHIINNFTKYLKNHDEMLTRFGDVTFSTYHNYVSQFGSVQQDFLYLLNYFANTIGSQDSLLDRIFTDFNESLDQLSSLLQEESNIKSALTEVFEDMSKIHSEGLTFFSSFEKFFVIMNNINILAQIEMSKKDFDGGNNTGLKVKFLNMLEQLRYFNENIKNRVQKMLVSLMAQINSFSDTQLEQSIFLLNTHSFLNVQKERLEYMKNQSKTTFKNIRDENSKIFVMESNTKKIVDSVFAQTIVFKRVVGSINDDMLAYRAKFNGLLSYYNVSLKDYTIDNLMIHNYEKNQLKV